MSITERTPEAVFDFWLGPMKSVEDTTEDNWRNGMLKWRVGVFARGSESESFREAQREWCEQIHQEGIDAFFSDPAWDTPKGFLAKTIVLDQFGRCVYRGTPVAYANDPITSPMLLKIIENGWDINVYNEVERMWVYVALSHPERREMQELSVEKWTRWSSDLVTASPAHLKKTNQHVSWYFIKSIIEHAEAVLIFGRFPHRNPIMNRPHKAGEVFYLTDAMRPLWSFTQPPRPDYFGILGALCRMQDELDVDSVPKEAVAALHRAASIDINESYSAMDVFDLTDGDTIPFARLYRHLRMNSKRQTFEAFCNIPMVADLVKQVTGVILKDPNDTWPPKSAKHSVPAVIDVPAVNEIVRCHSFTTGDLTVSMSAVNRLVDDMKLVPVSPEVLMEKFKALCLAEPRLFRIGPDDTHMSAQLGKQGFKMLCGILFSEDNLDKVASRLYDVIDIDYDRSITTAEALMGLSLLCPGGSDVRTQLVFDIFDTDSNGVLDREEVHNLLRTVGLRGVHMIENLFDPYFDDSDIGMTVKLEAVRHYDEIEKDAQLALSRADQNDDGLVSREEFQEWVFKHSIMRQFIEIPNLLFSAVAR